MTGNEGAGVRPRLGGAAISIVFLLGLMLGAPVRAVSATATVDAGSTAAAGIRIAAKSLATTRLDDLAAAVANRQLVAPPAPADRAALIATLPLRTHPRMFVTPSGAEITADLAASPQFSFVPVAFSRRAAPQTAPALFGFAGLDALDSAIADGLDVSAPQVGYAIEPPDQGLCVGNNLVVEQVNLTMALYTTSGSQIVAPVPLNAVFGVPATDFISDPKCYYDPPTNTFFMSMTDLGDNGNGPSSLLIAAMNAASRVIHTYAIPTADDGSNGVSHPGCPCFGDQPLLGADKYGVYVTTNEFPLNLSSNLFNGAQIYAISKADLAAGASSITAFFIPAPIPLAEGVAYSMQPATSPDGVFDTDNGGVEFMMSTLDFNGAGDTRIAVWAITDTCALPSTTTTPCNGFVGLTVPPPIVRMGPYISPPPAVQKAGPIPFGDSVGNGLEQIDTGDDRMNQVVYANHKLYAGLNTAVIVGGRLHAGIRTYRVVPIFHRFRTRFGVVQKFIARPAGRTVLAHAGADIYYPSIGVTANGRAVMAFSISGAQLFPSAGWVPLYMAGQPWIHIAGAGIGPDDGFTGYPNAYPNSAGVGRWGDYTAATAIGNQIWMGAEYIGNSCTDAQYATDPLCGGTRAPEANWDTFISEFIGPKGTAP